MLFAYKAINYVFQTIFEPRTHSFSIFLVHKFLACECMFEFSCFRVKQKNFLIYPIAIDVVSLPKGCFAYKFYMRAIIWTNGFHNILYRIMCCVAWFKIHEKMEKVELRARVGTLTHEQWHAHASSQISKTSAGCQTNLISSIFFSQRVSEIERSLLDSLTLRQKSYHTIPFLWSVWAALGGVCVCEYPKQ